MAVIMASVPLSVIVSAWLGMVREEEMLAAGLDETPMAGVSAFAHFLFVLDLSFFMIFFSEVSLRLSALGWHKYTHTWLTLIDLLVTLLDTFTYLLEVMVGDLGSSQTVVRSTRGLRSVCGSARAGRRSWRAQHFALTAACLPAHGASCAGFCGRCASCGCCDASRPPKC